MSKKLNQHWNMQFNSQCTPHKRCDFARGKKGKLVPGWRLNCLLKKDNCLNHPLEEEEECQVCSGILRKLKEDKIPLRRCQVKQRIESSPSRRSKRLNPSNVIVGATFKKVSINVADDDSSCHSPMCFLGDEDGLSRRTRNMMVTMRGSCSVVAQRRKSHLLMSRRS